MSVVRGSAWPAKSCKSMMSDPPLAGRGRGGVTRIDDHIGIEVHGGDIAFDKRGRTALVVIALSANPAHLLPRAERAGGNSGPAGLAAMPESGQRHRSHSLTKPLCIPAELPIPRAAASIESPKAKARPTRLSSKNCIRSAETAHRECGTRREALQIQFSVL